MRANRFLSRACLGLLFVSLLLPGCGERAEDVDHLIRKLKDPDPGVRRDAAQALGKLGHARAAEPLVACLKDRDWRVRRGAAEALVKMGKPAVGPLIACLKDREEDARRHAAEALGKLADARAVRPLIACLKDPNSHVRERAAEALGKLGKAAVEPLAACLEDQDEDARRYAAEALAKLGDARAVEPLIASLKDPHVRQRAAQALWRLVAQPVAVINARKSLHPWHRSIPANARAPSVVKAHLVLVVGQQRETALSTHAYQVHGRPAPSITRYRYDLDVKLVEAKTGKEIARERFRTVPGPAPVTAPVFQTRVGSPVPFAEVEAWLLPLLLQVAYTQGLSRRRPEPQGRAQALPAERPGEEARAQSILLEIDGAAARGDLAELAELSARATDARLQAKVAAALTTTAGRIVSAAVESAGQMRSRGNVAGACEKVRTALAALGKAGPGARFLEAGQRSGLQKEIIRCVGCVYPSRPPASGDLLSGLVTPEHFKCARRVEEHAASLGLLNATTLDGLRNGCRPEVIGALLAAADHTRKGELAEAARLIRSETVRAQGALERQIIRAIASILDRKAGEAIRQGRAFLSRGLAGRAIPPLRHAKATACAASRLREAERLFAQAKRLCDALDLKLAQATVAYGKKRLLDAVRLLREVLAAHPGYPPAVELQTDWRPLVERKAKALAQMGRSYALNRLPTKARRAFAQARELARGTEFEADLERLAAECEERVRHR